MKSYILAPAVHFQREI